MRNGCLTELQFNLKHMFDLVGERGYELHNELVKYERWSSRSPGVPRSDNTSMNQTYLKHMLCSCAQEAPQVFQISGVRNMAVNYSDNNRRLKSQLPQRRLCLDFCEKSNDTSKDQNSASQNAPQQNSKISSDRNDDKFRPELSCDRECCDFDFFIFSFDKIQEWLDDKIETNAMIMDAGDVEKLSDLEISQFLVNSACKNIEEAPHDISLYICLHRIYKERFHITKFDFDRDNAVKAMSTCIEIIDSSNAKGMVGWLGYGKSNALDRSLNRSYETHSELASFYSEAKEWNTVYNVQASLLLRCEQQLPLYHPNTIAALLDLAAASIENGETSKAAKFSSRAMHRLKLYLDEQELACTKMLDICNKQSSQFINVAVLRQFGFDHLEMMRAFVSSMNNLVNRQFSTTLQKNHQMTLLFLRLVGDSFSSFATILQNASHSLHKKEHEVMELRSESLTAWMMAGKYYKIVLEAGARENDIYHPDVLSACSCFAHCLKQLGRLTQALKILSSILNSFLDTARKRSQLVNGSSVYSTLNYEAKRCIITCVWQMAMYTAEYKKDGEGLLEAIELLNIAINFLVHSFQSSEERLLKVLRGDLKRLLEGQYLTCEDASFDSKKSFACV